MVRCFGQVVVLVKYIGHIVVGIYGINY